MLTLRALVMQDSTYPGSAPRSLQYRHVTYLSVSDALLGPPFKRSMFEALEQPEPVQMVGNVVNALPRVVQVVVFRCWAGRGLDEVPVDYFRQMFAFSFGALRLARGAPFFHGLPRLVNGFVLRQLRYEALVWFYTRPAVFHHFVRFTANKSKLT